MRANKMSDWLDYVNQYVVVDSDQIRKKTDEELAGQQPLARKPTLVASTTKPLDLMIEGFCGDLVGLELELMDERLQIEKFPMGKAMVKQGEPAKSWLHAVIEKEGIKSVGIFAQCCGSYGSSYEEMIRRIFPNVTFYFLPVHDLFDNVHERLDQVVKAGIKAGVVEISK